MIGVDSGLEAAMWGVSGNDGERTADPENPSARVPSARRHASPYSFGRRPGDLARPLAELAARIEDRAGRIAAEVTSLMVGRHPAPADRTADLDADLRAGELQAFVGAIAASLRSGIRRADPELRERWRALGRRRAGDGVALPTVTEQLEVQARVVIAHVVAEWSLFGAGRSVEAHLMATTLELATERVTAVAEAYVDACLQRRSGGRASAERFLAVTVAAAEDPPPSLGLAGLRPAPAYVVIAVLLAGTGWAVDHESRHRLALQVESAPATVAAGALWAVVDRLGVLVVPATEAHPAWHEVVGTVCTLAGEHVPDANMRVGVAGPHRGLSGIRHGFEQARRTLEAAERQGWSGVIRPADVVLPALLVSAPDVATELAARVMPLGRGQASPCDLLGTLREHLAGGLSVEATSRALGLHHSTVRAHLGRVERILDLRLAEQVSVVALAVLAYDLGFATKARPGSGGSVLATDDKKQGAS